MNQKLLIKKRFCGPPNSGNGGYVCGMLDKETPYISEVTLRMPPPLEKDLDLNWQDDQQLTLLDGTDLVASVRPGKIQLKAPPAPSFEEAAQAAKRHIGYRQPTAFPTCFVCGLERPEQDGLQIYSGKLEGQNIYAAPWVPDASLEAADGWVGIEFLWAALDCPGAYAVMKEELMTVVLGRMTAQIVRNIKVGERCVVISWSKGQERKKHFCGTAIYNENDQLCAVGDAIWIRLDQTPS
ncbi:MAG: hypothetical protein AAF990_12810 [Bacteroidota bacterium]